jgi:two-component system, LytTR family, sensor kinase
MKITKAPRHQVIGFWISMPFITLALCYIMYHERLFQELRISLVAYPIIYLIGYFSWKGHSIYDYYLRCRYPDLKDTRKRVLAKLFVNILIMTPSVLLIFYVFHWFRINNYQIQGNDLEYGYLVGLAVNIVFESLWEVIYIIEKYKDAAAEKEMIEQMQLTEEFNRLKQKVNPHFLFNSFNTLSSLISEDKEKAEKFLDELSKVYRYLLRNNESSLTTVNEEIRFIESYGNLLKTRYGDAFLMEVSLNNEDREKEIPSMCLQLLVENVVKHNVISKSKPVLVKIGSTGNGRLRVENNLIPKAKLNVDSTGIGLTTIREKYRLLLQKDIVIQEDDEKYAVEIPLIGLAKTLK